ncbi:hypothetical protein V6Z12_A11G312200 [Gossypium hirsutum]
MHFVSSILQHSPHLMHLIFDKDHFILGPLTRRSQGESKNEKEELLRFWELCMHPKEGRCET